MCAVIAIDIDETIYSFQDAIRNVFFDMAKEKEDKSILRLAYSNNNEWRNLVDHDKAIAYEAIERVHENTEWYKPFPDAYQVIWNIKESGHDIKYIGSRKSKHYDITNWTIKKIWELPDGEVICADPQKPKNDYLNECQYLIDDRPKTIFDFLYDNNWQENNRLAFGLWKSYNQNLTDLKKLYLAPTWHGLRWYLERKNVIT